MAGVICIWKQENNQIKFRPTDPFVQTCYSNPTYYFALLYAVLNTPLHYNKIIRFPNCYYVHVIVRTPLNMNIKVAAYDMNYLHYYTYGCYIRNSDLQLSRSVWVLPDRKPPKTWLLIMWLLSFVTKLQSVQADPEHPLNWTDRHLCCSLQR